MKKSGLEIIFIFTVLICFYSQITAALASDIKVGLIPFKLVAQNPESRINEKIIAMIAEKIKSDGTQIILLEDHPETVDFSSLQKMGIQAGADYILTGSVFIVGQGISIDTRLTNIYEKDKTAHFYSDAENIENLLPMITELGQKIVGQIYQKKIISDIVITGNKRVEKDAIIRLLTTQTGEIIQPDKISQDLKAIYAMGYFDDVIVSKEDVDQGIKLIYNVTEKSTVRVVSFKNNIVYEDKELSDVIKTHTGSILNIHNLNSDMEKIRLLYTEKNYHNCSITYEIIPLENSQADILFTITEESEVKVEKITFEGNQYFTAKKIKKVMETAEKGFFSFFTGSGTLNEGEIHNDVVRIESLYKNNGFIDTKVSDPIITINKDMIAVHFKIEEGLQYKIKSLVIEGDIIVPEEELLMGVVSQKGQLYNREDVRKDILSLSDTYSNLGYANVKVSPLIKKNTDDNTMDIKYSIIKGEPVYFNRIHISGNSKTRDKVIRREIRIAEQELYSKEKIQQSFKRLNRLNYFEKIDIEPVSTTDANRMDLDVKVVEKQTGAFSIGGGFSTADGGFIAGSIEERNFLGKGQTVSFEAKFAQESVLYDLSIFEPYIFDTRVSGGLRLYDEEKEYDYYDKDAVGLSVNIGYRLFDYTTIGAQYLIEDYEITDVDPLFTNVSTGAYLTSSITPFIIYDTRDSLFLPTEGQYHKMSVLYAGEFLGGDIDYTKYLAEASVFFPLFWKFTGGLHIEGGYLDDRTDNTIDIDYTRFYLGGMKSIRGFDKTDINGRRAGDTKDVGGEKYIMFNAEVTFPLSSEYKLAGVMFYDRGDVYRTSENIALDDQFSSVGLGVRWDSPVGPLRIEYGWVIDGKDIKERWDGKIEFSVGASF